MTRQKTRCRQGRGAGFGVLVIPQIGEGQVKLHAAFGVPLRAERVCAVAGFSGFLLVFQTVVPHRQGEITRPGVFQAHHQIHVGGEAQREQPQQRRREQPSKP